MPTDDKVTSAPQEVSRPSAVQGLDSADPHPAEEGDPYNTKTPGAGKPQTKDVGPNPGVHDGTARPRPDNATTKATR